MAKAEFRRKCSGVSVPRKEGPIIVQESNGPRFVQRLGDVWHDNRRLWFTQLAESGTGDEVIMSIAGHVSRAMLSRYFQVRMEAKRNALDEIVVRQRAAEKRRTDTEKQATIVSQSAVVQ